MYRPGTFELHLAAVACLALALSGVHTCRTGKPCIYFRAGRQLSNVGQAGMHIKGPLTSHYEVDTLPQKDMVMNVPCGSSKGGTTYLNIIIVNQLHNTTGEITTDQCVSRVVMRHTVEYDRPILIDPVPSFVAQFCKDFTVQEIYVSKIHLLPEVLLARLRKHVEMYRLQDCIEVIAVHIDRPEPSAKMKKAFEAIEEEEKAMHLQQQRMKTQEVALETERQKQVRARELEREKSLIDQQRMEQEALARAARQRIQDQQDLASKKAQADAERYAMEAQANATEALYGSKENYLKALAIQAMHNNAKELIHMQKDPTVSVYQVPNFPTSALADQCQQKPGA